MTIPISKFEMIDQSAVTPIATTEVSSPLFLTAFASSKGPENMQVTSGDLFYKLYGKNIKFEKYGQPLLQAARIIDANGKLLCKRIVASDATLANAAIVAKVTKTQVQKTNDNGDLLYTDTSTGNETTVSEGNTAIMIDNANIKIEIKTIPAVKTLAEIATSIEAEYSSNDTTSTYSFPLFVIADNGRGTSAKKFRISANYADSKYLDYTIYTLYCIENDEVIETLTFTFNPDIIINSENKSLQSVIAKYSNQFTCTQYEQYIEEFIAKVAQISGNTSTFLSQNDILFGKDKKTVSIPNIIYDRESENAINLTYDFGLSLVSGSDGLLANNILTAPEYELQLNNFFNGTFTNDIYDLDNYKIDLIVDANYPATVKRNIEGLNAFREDAFYFRDCGTTLKSLEEILNANNQNSKDRYSATYALSYDVIDPYTKKQITVTVGYSLASLLVTHFKAGRNMPLAGQLHNFILADAIKGTVNFIPRITPSYDQKTILEDNRINYASYFEDQLVLETLWTSQENYTQLSFINNVLAIQEVVKAVRTKCPKIRYSFSDGTDLINYKKDVQAVLDKYSTNFIQLKMVYLQDTTMEQNKTFYAAIQVVYRNFFQSEYFKIYSLSEAA